jgi:hypothetical protein
LSGGLRAIIRVGVGRALYRGGTVETLLGSMDARGVSVDSVLSMLAACFSRSVAEKLNVNNVEVVVELYEDLDALLDGDVSNFNRLKVKIRVEGATREAVEGALTGCPFYTMLRSKIDLEWG